MYDKGLSRVTRGFLMIVTMFVNLAVTGFYCQSDIGESASALRAILYQKVILMVLYQLMVKKPKTKIHKFDPDLTLDKGKSNT